MIYRAWIVLVSVFSLVCSSQLAYGLDIKADNYDIYIGDINGDGYSDFYFSGKPLILILHGDISTPIPIFPGDFWVYRDTNGDYIVQRYTISSGTISQYVNSNVLRLAIANTDYLMWKNGTSDQTNILLRGASNNSPSLVLANFSGPLLPLLSQTIPSSLVANISNKDVPPTLADVNSDGKLDILVGIHVYIADISGIPASSPQLLNQAAPSMTVKYSYDELGHLILIEDPVNGNRNYQFDKVGNRLSLTIGAPN